MRMYHLPPHAFACLTGRHCIFLDLMRDGYFSVPRQAMEELIPWIHNWPSTQNSEPTLTTQLSDTVEALATELMARGMLTEASAAQPVMPRMARAADGDLGSMSLTDPEPLPRFLLRNVALALLYSDWALRILSIARIVDTVAKRKRSRTCVIPTDSNQVWNMTIAFLKYRPLFPRDYLCLFDSLALVRFLSGYHLYPDWVFGVQEDPFSAHCWVQAGAVVLNDHLDNVSGYTPIMTV